MKIGIGIDTGGTYTDAVLYDFESKTLLGGAKSLTTRNDLTIGILGAVDGLPQDLVRQAEVISLSTTLATNACVENKGGRAKLIFFGGDKKIIDRYGAPYGLPPSSEIYIQDCPTTFSGQVGEPDWEQFREALREGFDELDGVGIIEMNSVRNGAVIEKKAKAIFGEGHSIPVVCGHELFSELNCLQRGSSTLLNARLFPVISEFLESVKKALEVRKIQPKALVIVRSNGSLMSEAFASFHPIETLLCGPAASAIGCAYLTNRPNSLVVDMGGTTTDIALIREGIPVSESGGVSIGQWKTFVNGLYVKTFGLGGDSGVHYRDQKLYLEEYRVIPLCIAAAQYPQVLDNLRKLEVRKHTRFLYEHYMRIRDIEDSPRYNDFEKAFCRALQDGPLPIAEAAAAVGKEVYTLRVDRLLQDGVVQLCGLTPTDMMHIRGDFCAHNGEASRLAAEFAAFNLGISVEELCGQVYDQVKRKLYLNLVKAMLENKNAAYMKNGISSEVEQFILESYEEAKRGSRDPLLSACFRTDYTLIGVGAPIQVFLEDVAKLLGTESVIPQNHHVANALGAIVGSVSASCSVEILPNLDSDGPTGFTVFSDSGNVVFEELEQAEAFAVAEAENRARSAAEKQGARGEIVVTSEVCAKEASAYNSTVYLGTVVTASASGSMGF